MRKLCILNTKGISIIETLVAIGIMSIMMVGFTSMLSNQHKETKSVSEILAGLDLQKNLISVLSHGSVCSYIVNNPTQLSFHSGQPLPQTITPTLPIYANVSAGVPGAIITQVGQPASNYSSSMIVESIKLRVLSGSGTTYTANWIIEFDKSKSVRPHKPITVSTVLSVDNTTPSATKIVDCMSEQIANRYIQSCASNQFMAGYNADGSIKCNNMPVQNNNSVNTSAFVGTACPGNQTMSGFNSDGSIICRSSAVAAGGPGGGLGLGLVNNPNRAISTTSPAPARYCPGGYQTMGGYVCPYSPRP